jgi:catechol 2,3-dioxygenase-like lactoylglutathione lyase family enzyme
MFDLKELLEVILYVQDMPAQVAFYHDRLGLALKAPQDPTEAGRAAWVELETGPTTLALHAGGQRRLGEDAPKIVFRVEDVPAAREALLRRGVPMGEVRSPHPNTLVCDGKDPEGNPFSIESRKDDQPLSTETITIPTGIAFSPARRSWTV